ncbi:hypothetical protein H7F51_14405 [Novosphingobium flavum]|uniref:MFS transporter n=1 Tax=Novosphingobium flavum TaxID=1778672 RepID=A0A7X1FTI9_9SPHN|nr:MFS transporter [Novosphingobium flavum]MBC2666710.1 hypothetical protein [Novosphingobium flavum]
MRSRTLAGPVLFATIFLAGLSASAIGPYRGIVAINYLGMSNSLFATVTAISSIGTAGVSLLLGHFSDQIHDRRLGVLLCATFAGLAYALIFIVRSKFSYVAAFCAILPLGGALFSQSFSFSRAYMERARPGSAQFFMSALRTLYSLAWVVSQALVGWIAYRYSVFGVFGAAMIAQIALIAVFSLLFLIPETKVGRVAPLPIQCAPSGTLPFDRLVGIGGVSLLRASVFLHSMTLPLILTGPFRGTLADVSLVSALCAGLEIPFMLAWGYAAGRFAKEWIIIVNALLYAAYLLLVHFSHSVHDVLWLQGLNALAMAGLVSIPISYIQESIKGRVGLSTSLFDLMVVVAQIIASIIFAAIPSEDNFLTVLVAGSGISLAGALALGLSMKIQPEALNSEN